MFQIGIHYSNTVLKLVDNVTDFKTVIARRTWHWQAYLSMMTVFQK